MYQILLIDGNKKIQNMIFSLFSTNFSNYKVEIATDGEIGLEILKSETFNLVICEIYLNKKSGFDILRFIQEKSIQSKIIALTSATISKNLLIEKGFSFVIKKSHKFLDELNNYISDEWNT